MVKAPNFIANKRGKIYKITHVFLMSVLILNMSMTGVFFVTENVGALECYDDYDCALGLFCNNGTCESCSACDDVDSDDICDDVDNCVDMYNPDQIDIDNDGIGDVCDECVAETEICGDAIDNDCDGLIDCDDIDDCAQAQECYVAPIITIKAHKIVCESEDLLPDWHNGGDITANTAINYVETVDGCDWIDQDWIFEWGEEELAYNGDYIGSINEIENLWENFDTPSNWNVPAEVEITLSNNLGDNNGKIWFREELEEGYQAFSIPPGELPGSDISAEFYCDIDVEHYNNMEEMTVADLVAGNEYYCVAFNVLEEVNDASITGCKYNDVNNNSIIDEDEEKLGGWNIWLSDCPPMSSGECISQSVTTNSDLDSEQYGCYEFTNLSAGEYWVWESMPQSIVPWTQTYPSNPNYYNFDLNQSEIKTEIDFANHQVQCGDGICEEDENCETCSNDCGQCEVPVDTYCGDGEVQTPNDDDFDEQCDGSALDGYTCNDDCTLEKILTCHDTGTCGGGGGGGGGLLIKTDRFTGSVSEQPIVKGEEGVPNLFIIKTVSPTQVNRGDTGVEYIIDVANNGTLSAFTVTLTDILPNGLVYADFEETSHTWELGDIAPGETKSTSFLVNVNDNAVYGNLINTATAIAENHEEVSADATIEILEIKTLVETGFSWLEFFATAFSALALFTVGRKLDIGTV